MMVMWILVMGFVDCDFCLQSVLIVLYCQTHVIIIWGFKILVIRYIQVIFGCLFLSLFFLNTLHIRLILRFGTGSCRFLWGYGRITV